MITVYHSCFSTTGPFPDRPLPYSQAPSGCVRLLSIGTMRQLRLPCSSCVTPFVTLPRNTSVDFQLSLVRAGEIATRSPGCCLPVSPSVPAFGPKDAFGSPKFPANPSCICPALRPRPGLHARRLRRFGFAPVSKTTKAPTTTALSELNPTAFALAVYASCRPLGRRRKTRFRWLANLSGWAFSYPLSSFGEFLLRFLSPRTYLGATCSCSCSRLGQSRSGARARARARDGFGSAFLFREK